VLAEERFKEISTHLRSDLANRFENLLQFSSQRMRLRFGQEWDEVAAKWENLNDFVRSQFVESALLGLAANAQVTDAQLARPYLLDKNTRVRDAAVRVIATVGSSADVDTLLKIAKEAFGEVKAEAAKVALQFTSTPFDIARDLILDKSPDLKKVGFDWLYKTDSEEVKTLFYGLLGAKDDSDRVRALFYLSNRMSIKELEQLLKRQHEKPSYYYNVVTWLDRLLYSPMYLREMFLNELERQAK
jgi:hypothetical protein